MATCSPLHTQVPIDQEEERRKAILCTFDDRSWELPRIMGRKGKKSTRKRSRSNSVEGFGEKEDKDTSCSNVKKIRLEKGNGLNVTCEISDQREEVESSQTYKNKKRTRSSSEVRQEDAPEGDQAKTLQSSGKKKKKKSKKRKSDNSRADDSVEKDSQERSYALLMEKLSQLSKGSPYVTIPREGSCVLLARHPAELVLQGMCAVTVVLGDIEVMGFDTTGWPDRRLELTSATCSSLLTLHTVAGAKPKDVDKALCELMELQFEERTLLGKLDSRLVLLVCERVESPKMDFITSLPMYEDLLRTARSRTECNKDLAPCGVSMETPGESCLPSLSTSREVRRILQDLQLACADGKNPVIMVCGGRNTGKSTLNRFLLNKILKSTPRVYYLECDIGQTEFTPPGCLSLQEVTRPLLGLPFSHQLKSKRLCFYGGVSPADNPFAYVDCLKFVLEAFHSLESPGPLVVNTMGWNEGLGLLLLVDIVHLTQPDIVLQLQSGNRHRNFKAFTPDAVSQEQGLTFNSDLMQLDDSCVASKIKKYQFHVITSSETTENLSCFKLRPVDHRNLALLSHLCEGLPPHTAPTCLPPQSLAWRHLALHVCHQPVSSSHILYAFNSSVVALCRADLSTATKEAEDFPFTFQKLPLCECLGFGLVTRIDMDSGLIHLVTPVSLRELSQVTLLMKGAVSLPDQLLLQQRSFSCPFVDVPVDTVGSSAIRARDRMARRPPRTPQS